ncbi:hypothetical protein FF011L_16450 [Roseimaritima multifibrata]|uniref:Uncharacterized protein n=1 Tax=Roseimaritima multifibrata TaxID=1930274 RepID=A0A517MDC8_9BACT|nr:hypothetical protein [Roseimaritima multifibrata]QDS92891.1 hypothetical protein FF011L_16450 [Roseimaritima multifibrata]
MPPPIRSLSASVIRGPKICVDTNAQRLVDLVMVAFRLARQAATGRVKFDSAAKPNQKTSTPILLKYVVHCFCPVRGHLLEGDSHGSLSFA